jgi:hypothetical protein
MHSTRRFPNTLGSTSFFELESYITETSDFSVALSSDGMVGATWNRGEGRPNGFPHSYNHQQWFILPEPIAHLVLASMKLTTDNHEEVERDGGGEPATRPPVE